MARARSVIRTPDPALRGLVGSYHGYHYCGQAPGLHHGLPTTSLTLLLSLDRPVDVGLLRDESSRRQHWALASGMSTEPAAIYHDGNQHGIQLDLTPRGARALLGVPASALRREIVSLDDVIGSSQAQRMYDVVAAECGWPARFAALDRELIALASGHGRRSIRYDDTLAHAWRRLHETRGTIPVARLADEVGWSRRQLSRRFGDEFGIGPKQAARLVRFGLARKLVAARAWSLADVAVRCGYADQAHLTREWRDLAGVPPIAWLRHERPFLQDPAVAE